MDSDPYADYAIRRQLISEARGGCERAGGGRKRKEEGVSLRVHFDAAVSNTRLPDHHAVIGERIRVGLCAELVEQRRRAFDVGEDKGDGTGRKVGSHAGIIRSSRLASKGESSDIPHTRTSERCVSSPADVRPRPDLARSRDISAHSGTRGIRHPGSRSSATEPLRPALSAGVTMS